MEPAVAWAVASQFITSPGSSFQAAPTDTFAVIAAITL